LKYLGLTITETKIMIKTDRSCDKNWN